MDGRVIRLRGFREERGCTQREVAEHVQRLAWVEHGDHVGVNADMVAKWERGVKGVSLYYRELLALLYGVEPRMLGIKSELGAVDVVSQVQDLTRATSDLVEQLGSGAAAIRDRIAGVLHDQIARRRALLEVMGVLAMGSDDQHAPASSPAHDDLCNRLEALYPSTAPLVLYTAALAHFDAVSSDLRDIRAHGERRRLASSRARCATLLGRLSFFDLEDAHAARAQYLVAVESARGASDAQEEAAALTHLAFLPAAEGSTRAALDYLDGARTALAQRPHPLMTSWIDAVASEIHAAAGDHAASLAAIERAKDAATTASAEERPGWFDYYDATRLAGFAGYANLLAGRYDVARAELEAALALPLAAAKQRSVLLADLATVHFHAGELDEACRLAVRAVDELSHAGYATGSSRVRAFLCLVRPHASSPAVRHLSERVSCLN
jgi:transcriptional regulator with XRE-family HTH domain/tetratricopeptide (TPR) repeat protein